MSVEVTSDQSENDKLKNGYYDLQLEAISETEQPIYQYLLKN